MLQIGVQGLDRLVRSLSAFEVFRVLRPGMIRGMARAVSAMADYPAPPTGSTYRRQGTLGRRWTQTQPIVSEGTTELTVTVGNNTPYGPWVQNDQFQARVHQGRWQTDEDTLEDLQGAIVGDLTAVVQVALNGMGE